jgi:hypothetical protein
VKVYDAEVADFRSASGDVKISNFLSWIYKPTSCSLNAASSKTVPVYPPQYDIALPLYFQNDKYIIKEFAIKKAMRVELEAVIQCHLFLQVVCLSEI